MWEKQQKVKYVTQSEFPIFGKSVQNIVQYKDKQKHSTQHSTIQSSKQLKWIRN